MDSIKDNNPLRTAWESASSGKPLESWVTEISQAYFDSGLSLASAARIAGARQAEFLAVLQLASLDQDSLSLVSQSNPPKTTWLTLAKASKETIELCLEQLRDDAGKHAAVAIVGNLVRSRSNDAAFDAVATLPGEVIVHFGKKAKEYGALSENNRKALLSMGRSKAAGRVLSAAQRKYLADLLRQLYLDGVVSTESKDGDQPFCDLVIKAVGQTVHNE